MIIKCENCKNKIDLKTYISIQAFVSGCPIKCPDCEDIILYKGDN